MNELLPLRVSLKLGNDAGRHGNLGPFRVEAGGDVAIGRAAKGGLTLQAPWTPRLLCRLVSTGSHWLMINGPRASVSVQNRWLPAHHGARWQGKGRERARVAQQVGVEFLRGAVIALPEGVTIAEWTTYDDNIRLRVTVGGVVAGPDGGLLPCLGAEESALDEADLGRLPPSAYARCARSSEASRVGRRRGPGADRAVLLRTRDREGQLTARQRQVMASVFRHLLTDLPRPTSLAKNAALELDMTSGAVKKEIKRVRQKVNGSRDGWDLPTLDDLGVYLVEKTGEVTAADLAPLPEPSPRGPVAGG